MAGSDKLETLRSITREDKFRETVLIDLLDKMGLSPVHTHGSSERGKDIVCKGENAFHIDEWIAVVAKVGKITGSTSGPASFQTVLNQIQEAFSYSYKDPKTKNNVSINKVLVITNDEILPTAQEKIVDKLGAPSAQHANVHFINGAGLVRLIDENWTDFWANSSDLLIDEDRITEEAGLVLYVLARAYELSQSETKKKVDPDLTSQVIVKQTNLQDRQVDSALNYLIKTDYVEKKKDNYILHSKKTVGKLLTDPNQIRLFFAIRNIANTNLRFTLDQLIEECKSNELLKFEPSYVQQTMKILRMGKYIKPDKGRGSGHFILDMDTVDEEQAYLEAWLKHLGRVPTHED